MPAGGSGRRLPASVSAAAPGVEVCAPRRVPASRGACHCCLHVLEKTSRREFRFLATLVWTRVWVLMTRGCVAGGPRGEPAPRVDACRGLCLWLCRAAFRPSHFSSFPPSCLRLPFPSVILTGLPCAEQHVSSLLRRLSQDSPLAGDQPLPHGSLSGHLQGRAKRTSP